LADGKIYILVILLFLLYYLMIRIRFHAFCPVVIITGFPCPGCGMTRAVLLFLLGEFKRSWNLNPMAAGWILFAIWFCYRRYWCGKKVIGWKYMVGVLLAAMMIIYVYRMINVFPAYPPMVYTRKNLVSDYVPAYGKWVESKIYK